MKYLPIDEEREKVVLIENDIHKGFYHIPNNNSLLISKNGECISLFNNFKNKIALNQQGYLHIKVWNGKKTETFHIHRLLALTFIGRPKRHWDKLFSKLEVNHINSNRSDNSLDNLEWVTPIENKHHAREYGYVDDSKPILSRNVRTNEITRFKSIAECCRYFNIWGNVLVRHLKLKEASRITKNWCVFKYDDNSEWPKLMEEEIVEDSWDLVNYFKATHIKTEQIILASTLEQLSGKLQIERNYIKLHREKYGKNVPIKNWLIEVKKRNKNEKIDGLEEYDEYLFPPPCDVLVINNITGQKEIFSSLTKIAKTGYIKLATLSLGLKKKDPYTFGNYTYTKLR